jgi:hypothetical protein
MFIPLIDLRTIQHPPLAERFVSKVKEPFDAHNDCWLWTGVTDRKGYGKIYAHGKMQKAHRISYELFNGLIPREYDIDHLCKNRKCVNPSHLQTLARQEHYGQGHREQTHCLKGHPFDEVNTYYSSGHRWCRICRRNAELKRSPRKRKRR